MFNNLVLITYRQRCPHLQSRRCLEQAQCLFRQAGETMALAGVSHLFRRLGEPESDCDYGRRAWSLTREVVDPHREAAAMAALARALVELGELAEAADVYSQALTLRRQMGEQNLLMEPLAGLAHLTLVRGEMARAQEHIAEILVEHGSLDGVREPCQVYLTCYWVLQANGDGTARDVLARAYHLLQERAAAIEEDALRRFYLQNVAEHQAIVREFRRLTAGGL